MISKVQSVRNVRMVRDEWPVHWIRNSKLRFVPRKVDLLAATCVRRAPNSQRISFRRKDSICLIPVGLHKIPGDMATVRLAGKQNVIKNTHERMSLVIRLLQALGHPQMLPVGSQQQPIVNYLCTKQG